MNNRKLLEQIEGILNQIPKEQREHFEKYFQNAPDALLRTINIERRSVNKVLVEENEPIEKIYILMKGTVKAVDFRVRGSAYEFARFDGFTVLGSMECMLGIQNYMTTLITASPCILLAIPREAYDNWIFRDINALRADVGFLRENLLERSRENRIMFLLNGMERLVYLLVKLCESRGEAEEYLLSINRQELAEQSGSSVKTVNRSMKSLEESDFLTRVGHKVKITKSQYASMREYLELILKG